MIEFVIPAVPPSLNSWSRKHWSVRAGMAAKWNLMPHSATTVWEHTGFNDFPITPALVTLTFRIPRGGDADNRAKFVLDALVSCGYIKDDGPPHLVELRLRSERGKPAETRVRIEKA